MAVQSRTLRYHGSAESDSMYGIMAVQSRTLGYHGCAETDSTVSWQRKVGLYGIMAMQSRTLGYHGSAESDSTILWQRKVGLNGVMISVTHSLYRKPTFNSIQAFFDSYMRSKKIFRNSNVFFPKILKIKWSIKQKQLFC